MNNTKAEENETVMERKDEPSLYGFFTTMLLETVEDRGQNILLNFSGRGYICRKSIVRFVLRDFQFSWGVRRDCGLEETKNRITFKENARRFFWLEGRLRLISTLKVL